MSATILSKDRKLPPSQDFEFLRKAGLQYVEQLGNQFWTDYNAHDPGVTILEVLCYAITELGYRTDFDIKDLLTNENGRIANHTFFTAGQIFQNAALTETDYRKLLIDIPGVSNAWLSAVQKNTDAYGYALPHDTEANLYLNNLDDKISLQPTDRNGKILDRLAVRGLSKVKIELDDDLVLGDLNTLLLEFAFWAGDRWVSLKVIPHFTNWDHPDARLFKRMDKPAKISIESVRKVSGIVHMVIRRYSNPADVLRLRIFPDDATEINLVFNHFNNERNACEVISLFQQKKEKIETVFSTAAIRLQQNRNLCEDFRCITVVEKVKIGICADIEIETGADPVDVMARIQIAIDKVISPKINFYTLSQLVAEGQHAEDIFSGPRLEHGFLKSDEIENAQLPHAIHASDIFAVLMAVDGVKSVKNLLMTAYNVLGQPLTGAQNQSWVLALSGEVKPVFDAGRSKLLLFQKQIAFLLSESQQMLVDQKVMTHNMQFSQQKLHNTRNDFEIGTGDYYDLKRYYSIQDDFPANYNLGKNYLSEKATVLRKGQVKQLKGYLYFYEQILADFFSQLYNARDLFDTKPISQTYFPVSLETDAMGTDFYSKELFSGTLKTALLEGEFPNEYASLYESNTQFFERRNRALDHLLARFSESFNDYVFMMYRVSQDTSGMGEFTFDNDDLIVDKQNFLNDYPAISSKRGLGMDYLNAEIQEGQRVLRDFWNSDTRGGFEKRVAKLLGINHLSWRNIVTENAVQTQWTVETATEKYVFKIVSPQTNLVEKWNWSQQHFLDQRLYKVIEIGENSHLYLMRDGEKIARLSSEVFKTQNGAYGQLSRMMTELNRYYENFFCLEHVLLRPFDNSEFSDEDLLSVCLNDDCADPANNDPYSFKATIVLPGYLWRFSNVSFRKYVEQIFRQEAPAHVLLKICWVGVKDLLLFQQKYKNWLDAFRDYRMAYCAQSMTPELQSGYRMALHELVAALKELNTIYPEGNLYDCRLSDTNNPIILGNTALGTL